MCVSVSVSVSVRVCVNVCVCAAMSPSTRSLVGERRSHHSIRPTAPLYMSTASLFVADRHHSSNVAVHMVSRNSITVQGRSHHWLWPTVSLFALHCIVEYACGIPEWPTATMCTTDRITVHNRPHHCVRPTASLCTADRITVC